MNVSNGVEKALVARFRQATGAPLQESVDFLSQFQNEQQRQLILIAETNNGRLHDPIEDNPNVKTIFETIKVEAEAQARQLQNQKSASVSTSNRGFCHLQWAIVKRLLLERHGISWRSPAELNPWITFD